MSILKDFYDFDSCNSELKIKQFCLQDLKNNCLIIEDALPGDIIVINSNGKVVDVIQEQIITETGLSAGVNIDLSQHQIKSGEIWKIRYNKMKDVNTTLVINGDLSSDDLILYSLIFN